MIKKYKEMDTGLKQVLAERTCEALQKKTSKNKKFKLKRNHLMKLQNMKQTLL